MITIIFFLFILSLYLLLSSLFGLHVTMIIFSILFLIMAILFSFKKGYYEKYMSMVNPNNMKRISRKSEQFSEKYKKINIYSFYIISITLFINSIMSSSSRYSNASLKDYMYISGIALVAGLLFYLIDNVLLKRTEDYGEYLFWMIIAVLVVFGK